MLPKITLLTFVAVITTVTAFPRPIEVFGSVQSNLNNQNRGMAMRGSMGPMGYRGPRNTIPTVGATMYQPNSRPTQYNSPGARYVDDRFDYASMNQPESIDTQYYGHGIQDPESPLRIIPRGVNHNYALSPLKTKMLEGFDAEDEALIQDEQMNMDGGFLMNAIPKQKYGDAQWSQGYAQTPLAQPFDLPTYDRPVRPAPQRHQTSGIARKTFGMPRQYGEDMMQEDGMQEMDYGMMENPRRMAQHMMPMRPQQQHHMMMMEPRQMTGQMRSNPSMRMPMNRPQMYDFDYESQPMMPRRQFPEPDRMTMDLGHVQEDPMEMMPRRNPHARITSINFGDADDSFESKMTQVVDGEVPEDDDDEDTTEVLEDDVHDEVFDNDGDDDGMMSTFMTTTPGVDGDATTVGSVADGADSSSAY